MRDDSSVMVRRIKESTKHRITDSERQVIFLMVEKSRLERERQNAVFSKGFVLFAMLLGAGWLGYSSQMISGNLAIILFVTGLVILLVTMVNYHQRMNFEDKRLDSLLSMLLD